jgi:hypothetical protein
MEFARDLLVSPGAEVSIEVEFFPENLLEQDW